jgi:signal transduction histidine kinase
VGQLAAGIAHEVNNPLAFARANLNLLRAEWEKLCQAARDGASAGPGGRVDEAGEVLDEALEGVDRAIAIMRDVTRFSRGGGSSRSRCELARLVGSALRFARPQIGVAVQVEESHAELPPVLAAAEELEQVFLNLILNAGQALGPKGRIRIQSALRGDTAVVSIEDDGPGIPGELLGRIFDPFFSTKPVGEGTGLGLAVSHEIVRRHGGELRVESRVGMGTRFEVRLPLSSGEEAG